MTTTTATATTALTCEISGEPLTFASSSSVLSSSSSSADAAAASVVVVTPSGHVCYRRLLLRKLAENGGVDPFHPDRRLTEDQLIVLQQASHAPPTIVPPKVSSLASSSSSASASSSFTSTLSLLQAEYDALVLELFDTRRALEETRRELSQALYQNDAAVRVVARLAMERDAAKQQWLSMMKLPNEEIGDNGNASGNHKTNNHNQKKRKLPEPPMPATTDDSEATSTASPLQNDIPETDVHEMIAVWERLHQGRKAQQKLAAARAPSVTALQQLHNTTLSARHVNDQLWHTSAASGVVALSMYDNLLLSVGTDQQVIVYDLTKQRVQCSFDSSVNNNTTGAITCVDHTHEWAVVGTAQGHVQVWQLPTAATATARLHGQFRVSKDATTAVVDVRIHPDGKHVLATSSSGGTAPTISLARVDVHSGVTVVAVFSTPHSMSSLSSMSSGSLEQPQPPQSHQYTCGALHPDGLIYVAGNHVGQLLVWDLKSKSLASTLTPSSMTPPPPTPEDDAVTAVQFSNNGYHIAAAHASSHRVVVWDLRKQKQVAVLNVVSATTPVILASVRAVAFDESGKYLAYSGRGGVQITTVKEWGVTATIRTDQADDEVTSVVWAQTSTSTAASSSSSQTMLVTASDKQRQVNFIVPTEKEE